MTEAVIWPWPPFLDPFRFISRLRIINFLHAQCLKAPSSSPPLYVPTAPFLILTIPPSAGWTWQQGCPCRPLLPRHSHGISWPVISAKPETSGTLNTCPVSVLSLRGCGQRAGRSSQPQLTPTQEMASLYFEQSQVLHLPEPGHTTHQLCSDNDLWAAPCKASRTTQFTQIL